MTQFVRINYQYGFLDPILTLGNLEAECFDVSADGSLVAYVAGNILDIYSPVSYTHLLPHPHGRDRAGRRLL